MSRQLNPSLLGPCLFAVLWIAACRDDRLPPSVVDAGRDDTGTVINAGGAGGSSGGAGGRLAATGGRSGSGGQPTGQGGSAGRSGQGGQSGGQGGMSMMDAGTGAGGSADAGLPDRPADVARDTSLPDLPGRDTAACPPVCAIFCPYGNVLDERGCPTCTCNPRECKPAECAAAAAPKPLPMMCPDGTTSGTQTCERDSKGKCHWVTSTCPPVAGCASATTRAACQAKLTCRWLVPGCTEPKLATPGCYERTAIGCIAGSCPAGKTCTTQVIDPCSDRLSAMPAEPMLIPPPTCDACGQQITVCL